MQHTLTLVPSGRQFVADSEETILHAARLQNIPLSFSCLNGTCGSCKATLIGGEVAYPFKPPQALEAAERETGAILLCQAVARSDLQIAAREVPAVAGIPLRQFAVRVERRESLSPDVVRIFLKLPRGEHLQYLPGQYLDLIAAGGKRRAFSLASTMDDPLLELHLKRGAPGGFTDWVATAMPENALLRVEGPLGTFVPRPAERPALFVAGGTGFAPIQGLLTHFLKTDPTTPRTLYWGARTASELYLDAQPLRWCDAHPSFRFVPVLSDAAGEWVHERVIADHSSLADVDVYMAGPPAMIAAARRAFLDRGLPEAQLYYDSFDAPPDPKTAVLSTL